MFVHSSVKDDEQQANSVLGWWPPHGIVSIQGIGTVDSFGLPMKAGKHHTKFSKTIVLEVLTTRKSNVKAPADNNSFLSWRANEEHDGTFSQEPHDENSDGEREMSLLGLVWYLQCLKSSNTSTWVRC